MPNFLTDLLTGAHKKKILPSSENSQVCIVRLTAENNFSHLKNHPTPILHTRKICF
jgi:hypothetical protein